MSVYEDSGAFSADAATISLHGAGHAHGHDLGVSVRDLASGPGLVLRRKAYVSDQPYFRSYDGAKLWQYSVGSFNGEELRVHSQLDPDAFYASWSAVTAAGGDLQDADANAVTEADTSISHVDATADPLSGGGNANIHPAWNDVSVASAHGNANASPHRAARLPHSEARRELRRRRRRERKDRCVESMITPDCG